MGHTYAEMFPNGEDKTFYQRYARYQQECAREISDIIEKNPIKNQGIQVGDKLRLYLPLLGMSRIRFDNKGESHRIRKLFGATAHYYSSDIWALAYCDEFTVWDKTTIKSNLRNEKTYLVRINKPQPSLDLFPNWVDIRYFSKEVNFHHNNI